MVRLIAIRNSMIPDYRYRLTFSPRVLRFLKSIPGRLVLRYRDSQHSRKFARLGLQRHTVYYEGQRFVYYSSDRKIDRPVLVLLHGFLDRGFAFRHVIASLISNNCLIVIDLPGHGGSRLPDLREVWNGVAIYRSLYRFLRTLCREKVHLLTHSMGGLLALKMHLYAQRLNENPFLSLCAIAPKAVLSSRAELENLRRSFFPQSIEEARSLLVQLHHGMMDQARDIPDFVLYGLLYRWSRPGFRYLAENTMERPEEVFLTRSELRKCSLPVTLIWGAEDQIVPPAQGRKLAAALNAELHIVPGTGHSLLSECPDIVVKITQNHLSKYST